MSNPKATAPLALVDRDADGGFYVRDSRNGGPIAWRAYLSNAASVACWVNASYPVGSIPPARDTLIFEVASLRIAGELV
jgi:hypothetical protein